MKSIQQDVLLLVVFPVLATILALWLQPPYLGTILLFFLPLALLLSYRTQHAVKKTLLFSFATGIPAGLVTNYLGVADQSWYVPSTLFPRIMGIVPLEDIILFILLIYSITMMYEHFLHHGRRVVVDHRMKYIIWPLWAVLLLLFVVVLVKGEVRIPYAYLWFSLVFVALPAVSFFAAFPRLLSKYIKIGSYFFFVLVLFELVGLQLRHWVFEGTSVVGWIAVGGYRLPVEEFIFWCGLSAIAILAYYEFFDDSKMLQS